MQHPLYLLRIHVFAAGLHYVPFSVHQVIVPVRVNAHNVLGPEPAVHENVVLLVLAAEIALEHQRGTHQGFARHADGDLRARLVHDADFDKCVQPAHRAHELGPLPELLTGKVAACGAAYLS